MCDGDDDDCDGDDDDGDEEEEEEEEDDDDDDDDDCSCANINPAHCSNLMPTLSSARVFVCQVGRLCFRIAELSHAPTTQPVYFSATDVVLRRGISWSHISV